MNRLYLLIGLLLGVAFALLQNRGRTGGQSAADHPLADVLGGKVAILAGGGR